MSPFDVLARSLPSLIVIVGALLLLRRWAQRGSGSTGADVRVVTRTGITKGAVVAVLAVGERRLLVGASERGVDLLAELDPEPVAHPEEAGVGVATAATPQAPRPAAPASLTALVAGAWNAARSRPTPMSDDRPRMAPIDRLRHLTVRRPVPSHPRRPTVVRRRT